MAQQHDSLLILAVEFAAECYAWMLPAESEVVVCLERRHLLVKVRGKERLPLAPPHV